MEKRDGFRHGMIIAGFGGQGILIIGNLLAYAAMIEGREVTYLPIYGVEMRGGTANCTIVISNRKIGSPIVLRPHSAIVMNLPSLLKYEPHVVEGGLLIINSSLIDPGEAKRGDLEHLFIPANELAIESGNARLANMIVLGAFVEKTKLVEMDSVIHSFDKVLDKKYHSMIPANVEALKKGAAFIRSYSQP